MSIIGRDEINIPLIISNFFCALIFVSGLILHKGVYVFSFNYEFTGHLQRNISADSAGRYLEKKHLSDNVLAWYWNYVCMILKLICFIPD